MSDDVIRSAAKPFPTRAALPWLVGAGVYALLLTLAPRLLNDPDSYSRGAGERPVFLFHARCALDLFRMVVGSH